MDDIYLGPDDPALHSQGAKADAPADDIFLGAHDPALPQAPQRPILSPEENAIGTAARGALSSIPFSYDVGAAANAAASYLPGYPGAEQEQGKSFGQRYREGLERSRNALAVDEAQRPYLSYGSQIAGALALPMGPAEGIAARAANYVPRTLANVAGYAALGAGYGAAYGAGSGTDLGDRLSRAEIGATLGTVGGAAAPLVAGVGRNIYGKLAAPIISPSSEASSAIGRTLVGPGAMSPQDFAAAQAVGQPAVMGDLGTEQTRRLARWAANTSPEAAATLKSSLLGRYQAQADRFGSFLQNMFGTDLNNQDVLDAIRNKATSVNTPAYKAAYAQGAGGIWNSDLENLVQSPAVKTAIRSANERAINDAVINKQPIVRNPFAVDANGNVTLAQDANGNRAIPTLQYWDQVKRALDDQVSSAYNSGNRALGGQLRQVRDYLVNTLDNDPSGSLYSVARSGAWNWIGARDAVEASQKFLGQTNNLDINAVKKGLNNPNMTPDQREAFAQALAGAIFQKVQRSGDNRNIVNMFNSPDFRSKIAAGLGQQRSDEIEGFLRREGMMDALKTKVMGNSTTAEQTMDLVHRVSGPLAGALAGGAGSFYHYGFDPTEIGKGALMGAGAGALAQGRGWMNSRLAEAVAEKMISDNPQDISFATRMLSQYPESMNAFRRFTTGAMIGAPTQLELQGRAGHAKGGSVKPSHDHLVSRLMSLAETAKKAEKERTKAILSVPDDAVTTALQKAQAAI